MAKNQFQFSAGEQLFITQGELAPALRVKPPTVGTWIKKGWITPRYKLVGGRNQAVFLRREVERFVDWYLATLETLDAPCKRGSRHDRINNNRAKARRCASKASQASRLKHLGAEQEEGDPVPLGRGSTRRWDMKPPRPRSLDPGLAEGWDDEMEPER